jgi:DNA mismatch endonuclease Vsr
MRAVIVARGLRGWTLHSSQVIGKPDFFFPAERVAVFVDGCFWHGCPLCGHLPKTNIGYWHKKLARNKARDIEVKQNLRKQKVSVLRFWECEVRNNIAGCVETLAKQLLRRDL